ncbi:unnamed protein product [Lota lota]
MRAVPMGTPPTPTQRQTPCSGPPPDRSLSRAPGRMEPGWSWDRPWPRVPAMWGGGTLVLVALQSLVRCRM